MALTKTFARTFGQFLPNGATPTTAAQNNTWSTGGTGISKTTSLRLRTDIEMYVLAGGGTGDVDLSFAHETLIVVGGIMYEGGAQTSSATPLTDANPSPATGQLGSWGQWEYLYPEIEFVNVNVPQTVLVTWRPQNRKTIDTQFRREQAGVNGIDLFMPWEIQDGSGLINTTDTHGNTYNLGVRFAQAWLFEQL